MRAHLPRFSGANLASNQQLVQGLASHARALGITASQLAIAWVLARGDDIVPVVGARKRSQLAEALGALTVKLSAEEMASLERVVSPDTVAGARYDPRQMQALDSERGRSSH